METTIVYWDYIGTMENKMETTIVYRFYHHDRKTIHSPED